MLRRARSAKAIKRAGLSLGKMEVMGTSQDTFLRFVDSLTSHLDDHQARGDELAARAHLSRFHSRISAGLRDSALGLARHPAPLPAARS